MQRIPQIDGLRAIAILMVFLTHALDVPVMWAGVDLFFVLSGYLITGILLQLKDGRQAGGSYWGEFYSRRVRRILPPYLGFLVVLSLVWRIPWQHIWYWYVFPAANLPLALGAVKVAAMGSLWSLAVEEQFYFIWPSIVLFCSGRAVRRLALAIMIGSPLLRAFFTPVFATHFPIYSLTIFRADTLAAGAFIAVAVHQDSQWIARHQRIAAGVGAGVIVLFLGLSSLVLRFRPSANGVLFNSLGYSLIALAFGCTLIYALGMQCGWPHRGLSCKPLRYLGLISYTFYLYHEAVLLLVGKNLHSRALIAAVAFMVTTAIAAVSWHAMEERILKMPRRTISASPRSSRQASSIVPTGLPEPLSQGVHG